MDMTGEYRIPAPRQRVWDALFDPEILKQCIPGCEEIERTTPTEWKAKVRTKVGPVSATFRGALTLSDLDPPSGCKLTGKGEGGAAGFAQGGADVRLADDGPGTLLKYEAHAQVGGKLAQIGSRFIDSTARKMAEEFFGKFASVVGAGAPVADAPAAEPAAPVAPPGAPSQIGPGLDARAANVLAADGSSPPYVAGAGVAPGEPPMPHGAAAPADRSAMPTWAWIVGLAVIVAILLAIFAR
jgi:carbon monoxide dehydrogenase subunit G